MYQWFPDETPRAKLVRFQIFIQIVQYCLFQNCLFVINRYLSISSGSAAEQWTSFPPVAPCSRQGHRQFQLGHQIRCLWQCLFHNIVPFTRASTDSMQDPNMKSLMKRMNDLHTSATIQNVIVQTRGHLNWLSDYRTDYNLLDRGIWAFMTINEQKILDYMSNWSVELWGMHCTCAKESTSIYVCTIQEVWSCKTRSIPALPPIKNLHTASTSVSKIPVSLLPLQRPISYHQIRMHVFLIYCDWFWL